MNAMYNNIQFSNTLLFTAYIDPNNQRPFLRQLMNENRRLWGFLEALLGLMQVCMLWACSTLLYDIFLPPPLERPHVMNADVIARITLSAIPASSSSDKIGIIAALLIVQAAITVLPSAWISLTKRTPANALGLDFLIGTLMLHTWVALVCVIAQFEPLYILLRSIDAEVRGRLVWLQTLQGIILLFVAWRWFLRLGRPPWWSRRGREVRGRQDPWWRWLIGVYEWGWLPTNYLLHSLGCFLVMCCT